MSLVKKIAPLTYLMVEELYKKYCSEEEREQ